MAPEIILKNGHTFTADWWSLGTIIYDMLIGKPPFTSEKKASTAERIVKGRLHFPNNISKEAVKLIKGLLTKNPSKRLGANGVQQIQKQAFFKDLNWIDVERRKVVLFFISIVLLESFSWCLLSSRIILQMEKLRLSTSIQGFSNFQLLIPPRPGLIPSMIPSLDSVTLPLNFLRVITLLRWWRETPPWPTVRSLPSASTTLPPPTGRYYVDLHSISDIVGDKLDILNSFQGYIQ